MKQIIAILFYGMILFSCQNKETFIIGTWEIEGIGTADTSTTSDKILAYAVLSMQSAGTKWEFTKDGSFKITYQDHSPFLMGEYSLVDKEKTLVLKVDNKEEKYELNKISDSKIQIKSTETKSIINLIKK